jgi:hypothetical protein
MAKQSKILLPEGVEDKVEDQEQTQDEENVKEVEINYPATERDEECFFLMYHMGMAPSEAYALKDDHRRWLMARFIGQKQMEREMVERNRLAQAVMANPQGPPAGMGIPNLRVQR